MHCGTGRSSSSQPAVNQHKNRKVAQIDQTINTLVRNHASVGGVGIDHGGEAILVESATRECKMLGKKNGMNLTRMNLVRLVEGTSQNTRVEELWQSSVLGFCRASKIEIADAKSYRGGSEPDGPALDSGELFASPDLDWP